jgi:hypothetical protein
MIGVHMGMYKISGNFIINMKPYSKYGIDLIFTTDIRRATEKIKDSILYI